MIKNDRAWLQTFTGKKFYPFDPDPELICIEDIAHGLSMECRYSGQCRRFYSVAQHSVLMARDMFVRADLKRQALLHDAHEAYLKDLPSPLKQLPEFQFYKDACRHLQKLINVKFGLDIENDPAIKQADKDIGNQESDSYYLMAPRHPEWQVSDVDHVFPSIAMLDFSPWLPDYAERLFMDHFDLLFDGVGYEEKTLPSRLRPQTASA